jgi:hypothetical protein
MFSELAYAIWLEIEYLWYPKHKTRAQWSDAINHDITRKYALVS